MHSIASSQSISQQGQTRQLLPPEDVDGALRISPLASVVPASGGKSHRYT
jgi:hypothetical protein